MSPLAPAVALTVASKLAEFAPVILTLLDNDNSVGELEEQLEECARLAERQVNEAHFGNRAPTRAECGEEVMVDGCSAPITRDYHHARFLETVSREEEARLIAQGCTLELWRTIKPDIVLHDADGDLRRSALTLDFKFPCPDTNEPRWTRYGENSAYAGYNQRQIYKSALGGETLIISPRGGVTR